MKYRWLTDIIIISKELSLATMDWKNRLDQIKNKVKTQLNAKGVDSLL